MADQATVAVRPRTGIILPGIPRSGARIPRALAEEWIADHLVVRLADPTVTEPAPVRPKVKHRRRR